jgi:elongation factor G
MGDLNKRRGIIQSNEAEADDAILGAHVPLGEMFGYSTALRSMTQAKPLCASCHPI